MNMESGFSCCNRSSGHTASKMIPSLSPSVLLMREKFFVLSKFVSQNSG